MTMSMPTRVEPHPVDEVLPAPRLLVLGLQHLFIMYAGAVAVPLIVLAWILRRRAKSAKITA